MGIAIHSVKHRYGQRLVSFKAKADDDDAEGDPDADADVDVREEDAAAVASAEDVGSSVPNSCSHNTSHRT